MSHGPSEAFQSQLEVKSFRKFCGQISKGVITLSQIKSYRSLGNNIFTQPKTKKISKVNLEQITSEIKKLKIHYQRQLNITRKHVFMHKTLPLVSSFHKTLSLSVPITLFSHAERATSKSDLLPFLFIKCNFFPHTFFTENTHATFLKQPRT